MTGVVWFQRDLRVRDHPALRAALDRHDRVVPVFCFDERLLRGRHASGPRTRFLLECLAELDARLRELGSGLVVRRGRPEQELTALAREIGASSVHFTSDVSPFARRRSESVRRALGATGVEMVGHSGLTAVDDIGEVRTRKGGPYTVFSPFHRNWLDQHRRSVLRVPQGLPQLPPRLRRGRLPSLRSLGLAQAVSDPPPGGEAAAGRVLDRFLAGAVLDYANDHDALGKDCTSRLSPYLHLGCITPRQIEERLPLGRGPDAFRRQLCTTGRVWSLPRFSPRTSASTGVGASAGSCGCSWTATKRTTTGTGNGSRRSALTHSRRFGGYTTPPFIWSAMTRGAPTSGATSPRCAQFPTSISGSPGRCPRRCSANAAASSVRTIPSDSGPEGRASRGARPLQVVKTLLRSGEPPAAANAKS